jgi:hypothetical protein
MQRGEGGRGRRIIEQEPELRVHCLVGCHGKGVQGVRCYFADSTPRMVCGPRYGNTSLGLGSIFRCDFPVEYFFISFNTSHRFIHCQ